MAWPGLWAQWGEASWRRRRVYLDLGGLWDQGCIRWLLLFNKWPQPLWFEVQAWCGWLLGSGP